jgi:predicted butyrate kinase (DUF1464 family)
MGRNVRAVGIDPGTVSFDVCGLEGNHLFLDTVIPTAKVAENPQTLVDLLQSAAPREILISGRLFRIPEIRQEVVRRLSPFAPVRRVKGFAQSAKEAAQGAALIAEGLAGGMHERLVEVMELRGASDTVLDHLYVAGAEALRQRYLG